MPTFYSYSTIGIPGPDLCNCVLEVAPNIKRLSGDTTVTITLNATSPKLMTGATGATFGGVAGTDFTVTGLRTATVKAPAGTASTQVDVVVTLADASTVTAQKGFWYPDWAALSNVLVGETNDGGAGTATSGSLTAPATPTGLTIDNIGHTEQLISWNMSAITGGPPATYELSSDGISANIATGIVGLNYRRTGLTQNTEYPYYVRARNDAEPSAWSTVVKKTTPVPQALLDRIESTATAYLDAMAPAGGYWFNWISAQHKNKALAYVPGTNMDGSYAIFTFELNEGEDAVLGAEADMATAYENILKYKITAEIFTNADVADPKTNYRIFCYKILEDLKKVFSTNIQTTAAGIAFWDVVNYVEYQNFNIEDTKNGDIMVPGKLITNWLINYSQLRTEPRTVAV